MPPKASRFSPVAVTMMSASSSLPGLQLDAALGERLDPVGDDRDAAAAELVEQVGVRHDAQALVPRVVARVEVRVDRIALGQVA